MDQRVLIVIVVAIAVVVLAAILIVFSRRRRSTHLKEHFGAEYDRTVSQRGNPAKAEADLLDREKRVEKFAIKPMSAETRNQYSQEWAAVQRRFVDDPVLAVTEADTLVNRVMSARGYPTAEFEQRAADISVHYPRLVDNYRSARVIAQRHARGEAGTEDMRQAMVYYRSLFAELLDIPRSVAA